MHVARHLFSALMMSAALAAPMVSHADPGYSITVVGAANSSSTDINSSGAVVGYVYNSDFSSAHGFVNTGSGARDLGTFGGANSYAWHINDSGQVVGTADTGDGFGHAFLYTGGSKVDLGAFGGLASDGNGINNAGTVVGDAQIGGGNPHAFLLPPGGAVRDLGTLPSDDPVSVAFAINSAGQVTGGSSAGTGGSSGPFHAFMYCGGVMTDLGTFGGLYSNGFAINDHGEVAGYAETTVPEIDHAFLFSAGVMHDLGTLSLGGFSIASDVNNLGQVVGVSDNRAFLYTGSGMIDLNTLIDPASGWTLRNASAINELGQIAANACTVDGACFAVRLDPVPEPETCAMLLAGLGLLGWRAQRRTPRPPQPVAA